jgi:hypothetical protein
VEVAVEADVRRMGLKRPYGCLGGGLGTFAAVGLGFVAGEVAVAEPGSAAVVAGSVLSGLQGTAAPIRGCAPEGCLHRCPQKSEGPLVGECHLVAILSAYPARYVADLGEGPPAGSSPPLASADPPPPLREANSASTHPVQPTEKEEQAGGLVREGLLNAPVLEGED